MSEGQTIKEAANQQRWCMAEVEKGKEAWPQGESCWQPLPGYCKARGLKKVNGEWRCKKHLPKKPAPAKTP